MRAYGYPIIPVNFIFFFLLKFACETYRDYSNEKKKKPTYPNNNNNHKKKRGKNL
jgi:hypothetical protein